MRKLLKFFQILSNINTFLLPIGTVAQMFTPQSGSKVCLVLGVQSWERIEANLYMALRFLGSPSDPALQVIFNENKRSSGIKHRSILSHVRDGRWFKLAFPTGRDAERDNPYCSVKIRDGRGTGQSVSIFYHFPFWNIFSCFRASFPVLERLFFCFRTSFSCFRTSLSFLKNFN